MSANAASSLHVCSLVFYQTAFIIDYDSGLANLLAVADDRRAHDKYITYIQPTHTKIDFLEEDSTLLSQLLSHISDCK